MRLSFFCHLPRMVYRKPKPKVCENPFEKEFTELMQKSEEALQDISSESFNSETLKTMFLPNYKPKKPGCMEAISTKESNRPVEVYYRRTQIQVEPNREQVSINIFADDTEKTLLGNKQYIIDTCPDGKKEMQNGFMQSDEIVCQKAGIKGIGTIEDILQIRDAIINGIGSIPRHSYARSTLFHVKMGFKPVQQLIQVNSPYDVVKILDEMKKYSMMDIAYQNYTPIIVFKDNKYYLDSNTTQCIANIRQIKHNYKEGRGNGVRPFIRGRGIQMELAGENYNKWKQLIKEMFSNV